MAFGEPFRHSNDPRPPWSAERSAPKSGVIRQDLVGDEKLELWVNYLNECSFQYCEAATRDLGC